LFGVRESTDLSPNRNASRSKTFPHFGALSVRHYPTVCVFEAANPIELLFRPLSQLSEVFVRIFSMKEFQDRFPKSLGDHPLSFVTFLEFLELVKHQTLVSH
jgi:hypothetical protein